MDYSLNRTLYNRSLDYDYYYHKYLTDHIASVVFASTIFSIEIPFICAAIYFIFFITKSGQGAPVFVINLLILDLIQILCFLLDFTFGFGIFTLVLIFAFYIGMYFMTCIAVERYLLIAHPVWYRSHHPLKCLVCTSLSGWCLPCIIFPLDFLFTKRILLSILPIIYYLVILLCFVGARRALSHSQSVTSIKRRLVLASLFFVLLSYTFTVLPLFISFLLILHRMYNNLTIDLLRYAIILNALNPITDCVLYVFIRNDVGNAIKTPQCCPRRRRIQNEIPLTNVTEGQPRNL